MLGRVGAIALNTFREAIRNKVLYILLIFAVVLIVAALALGQMSLHEETRITRDVGLGGMTIVGVALAIFVGVNLVYKELDKKTVFILLPKPVHRYELILGKYAGMVLTLAVQVAIMTVVMLVVLHDWQASLVVLRAIVLLFVEIAVIAAVAVLFSSFSTPILSGAFTLGIFGVGRFLPELHEIIGKLGNSGLKRALNGVTYVFPDLRVFQVSGAMLDGQRISLNGAFVDWSYVGSAAAYGAMYAGAALVLAILAFSRRDFV
jgi:ABC-type transport system involved in multi-copper enzyme maturation permease subunit